MNFLMCSEVGTPGKRFVTFLTTVRSLSSMNSLMSSKNCTTGKGFVTFLTTVRSL
ncbi:hypothetical protein LEMLEM_LOCUS19612, partial [Lemmus lemmus]